MRSGNDRAANEARALALLGEAADRGAALIGLPEMWEHIGPAREKQAFAGPVDGPQLARIRELCSKRGVYCLAGSIAERASDGRVYNTSALVSPRGEIAATYRKLHLFDVDIPDGARYRESDRKSTRLNSSHLVISYAVFCLKKKKKHQRTCTS